jgi:tetratricopeptide (TPR) repeat protein
VDLLLNLPDLPGDLLRSIRQKTEGNPFYIEELIHSLIESETLVKADRQGEPAQWRLAPQVHEIHIPDSIQSLILARLDRLDPDTRMVLQLASVLGRSFEYRALEKLVSDSDGLSGRMNNLERADIVYEVSHHPQPVFAFRHALTQETVYNAILIKQRRSYHLRAGEALEALSQQDCVDDEACSVLAHHFDQAGDPRALHYYRMAGDHAFRLYALSEAIAAYSRAIELSDESTSAETLQHIYLRCGRSYELSSENKKAYDTYVKMEDLARQRNEKALLLAGLIAHAVLLSTPSDVADFERAQELSSEALSLAENLDDRVAQARILWTLQLSNDRFGNAREAVQYGEQALELAHQLEETELLAYVLNDLGHPYYRTGKFERARKVVEQALEIWKTLDNKAMQVDSLATLGLSYYFAGEYDKTFWSMREADRIAASIGNLWGQAYCRMYAGLAYFDQGEPGTAIEVMNECLRLGKEAGFMAPALITQSDLAVVYCELGAFEQALAHAESSLKALANFGGHWEHYPLYALVIACSLSGRIEQARSWVEKIHEVHRKVAQGSDSEMLVLIGLTVFSLVEERFEDALECCRQFQKFDQTGIKCIASTIALWQATALSELDRVEEAYDRMLESVQLAEHFDQRRVLWQAWRGLAQIEAKRGDASAASRAKERSAEHIRYIADRIGDPVLRETFLNKPEVSEVLAQMPAESS